MKSVILLAILVTQALAQVPRFGRCPRTSVIQNFNVPLYLGRWFEIRKYPAIFQLGGRCVEANYGLNPNGTVSVLNKMIRLGEESSLGNARLADPASGEGILIVNFPQSPETDTPNYYILGTDYLNYAVVHSCSSVSPFANVQFAWVLSRRRTLSLLSRRRVERILEANGIDMEPFRDTDQSNCN